MSTAPTRAAMAKTEMDYQAEDDLRHLTRAAQVRADPQRHKRALAKAKAKMSELKAVHDASAKKGA